jgi:hypothetical protein
MEMKRALLWLALGGVCLATSGCGAANALDPVANAATKTAKVESAHFHMDLTVGPFQVTGDGVSDSATHSAQMAIDAGQYHADMVLDGTKDVLYARVPALTSFLPSGKEWVSIDLQKAGQQAGLNVSQLFQQVGSQDPTQALQMLESVGDVQKVGTAQVGGVDTTEYSAQIDLQKVVAKYPGTGLDRYAKLLGSKTIPVEVWIGGDGLVRKVHEQGSHFDLTFLLSDFGAPVTVTLPPADQVADLSSLKGH